MTGMGKLIASKNGVQVYLDGDDRTVVKGRGCGTLTCAVMESELICGDEYVLLTGLDVVWLESIEDRLEAGFYDPK